VFPAFPAAYRLSPRPSRDITPPLSSLVARAIHRESGNPEPDISRRIETRKKIELTLHFTNCAVLFSLSLSLSFSLSLSLSLFNRSILHYFIARHSCCTWAVTFCSTRGISEIHFAQYRTKSSFYTRVVQMTSILRKRHVIMSFQLASLKLKLPSC